MSSLVGLYYCPSFGQADLGKELSYLVWVFGHSSPTTQLPDLIILSSKNGCGIVRVVVRRGP